MKLKLNKKQKSLLELSLLIVIPILTFLLWENPVLYPIKIFSVLMHEISHGLTAIFTGGYVLELNLSEYLGGSLISSGGNQFVIASSGYLGSLLFFKRVLRSLRNLGFLLPSLRAFKKKS